MKQKPEAKNQKHRSVENCSVLAALFFPAVFLHLQQCIWRARLEGRHRLGGHGKYGKHGKLEKQFNFSQKRTYFRRKKSTQLIW
ncbi:MAG: hypothetical protein WCP23_08955 [Planctomycetota bacterium]